jgi:hypothetical protein
MQATLRFMLTICLPNGSSAMKAAMHWVQGPVTTRIYPFATPTLNTSNRKVVTLILLTVQN